MDIEVLSKLKTTDYNKVGESIFDKLKELRCSPDIFAGSIAVAYVFYYAKSEGIIELTDPLGLINNEIKDPRIHRFVRDAVAFGWENISSLYGQFDDESLKAYILHASEFTGKTSRNEPTPASICRLASTLLNIQPGDNVADLGTGRGGFIIEAYSNCQEASYYGNEIYTDDSMIAHLRATLLGSNVTVVQEDMFNMDNLEQRFDKVFSNYPFGLRIRDLAGGLDFLGRIENDFPDMTKATSSDWIFNALLITCMKKGGKAIGIMTNGSTWNSIDKPIREFFVRKGFVECLIALPDSLFDYTQIPTTMVVFSSNNKSVRMIDAQEMFVKGRRQNILSSENIDEILRCYSEDSKVSKNVSIEDLAKNDFVLSPIRYLTENVAVENGVPLASMIKTITRGAPCTAAELDEIVSHESTSMQYLMLANIKDGIIDEELPYLTKIDKRYEKYCLNDKCLLLSKNGYPFKVAVARVKPGKKILANGNLYVIDLDETKLNPYYLKAYFESEQGIAALRGIAVGAAIPNIAVEPLKKLMIPIVSLDQQRKIADRYLATLDEIAVLKLKIAKATNSLKNILEFEKE